MDNALEEKTHRVINRTLHWVKNFERTGFVCSRPLRSHVSLCPCGLYFLL